MSKLWKVWLVLTISIGLGCGSKDTEELYKQDGKIMLSKVSVEEAAKLLKEGSVVMVDANGTITRKFRGVVPGARLLSHYRKYDEKELQASKQDTLVFYCGSEKCSSAPKAAQIASAKGYQVKVMDAGIKGWIRAGHEVAKL